MARMGNDNSNSYIWQSYGAYGVSVLASVATRPLYVQRLRFASGASRTQLVWHSKGGLPEEQMCDRDFTLC